MKRKFISLLVILALILPMFSVNVAFADDTDAEIRRELYRNYVRAKIADLIDEYPYAKEGTVRFFEELLYYYGDITGDGQDELITFIKGDDLTHYIFTIQNGIVTEPPIGFIRSELVEYQGSSYLIPNLKDKTDRSGDITLNKLSLETKNYEKAISCVYSEGSSSETTIQEKLETILNGTSQSGYYINDKLVSESEYTEYSNHLWNSIKSVDDKMMTYDEFMNGKVPEETENITTPIEFYKLVHYYDSGLTYLFKMKNNTNAVSQGTYIIIPYHSGEKDGTFPYGYTEINYEIEPYTTSYGQISFDPSFVLSSFGYHEYVAAQKALGTDEYYMLVLKLDETDNVEDIKKELEENDIHTGWFVEGDNTLHTVQTEKSKAWLAQYVK